MAPTTSDPRRRPQSSIPSTSNTSSSSDLNDIVPSTSTHSPIASTSQSQASTSRDNRYDPYSQSARPKSANPARAESKPKPPAPYNTQHPQDPNLFWCRICHDYRYRTEFTSNQLSGYIDFSASSSSSTPRSNCSSDSNRRSSNSPTLTRRGRGGKDYQHPRCKRCVTTPINKRRCIVCNLKKPNTDYSESQRKSQFESTCKSCVTKLENKKDKLKRREYAPIQADPWAQNEEDSSPSDHSDNEQDLSISSVQSLDSLYKVNATAKGYEMLDQEDDEED